MDDRLIDSFYGFAENYRKRKYPEQDYFKERILEIFSDGSKIARDFGIDIQIPKEISFKNVRKYLDSIANRANGDSKRIAELRGMLESDMNLFAEKNMNLIRSYSTKCSLLSKMDYFDVHSAFNECLYASAAGFDFNRGIKFSTYIVKTFDNWMKKNLKKKRWRAEKVNVLSLDQRGDNDSRGLNSIIPDNKNKDSLSNLIANEELNEKLSVVQQAIREVVSSRDSRDANIIESYFDTRGSMGKPLTYEELGERHGLTKERVRQILEEARKEIKMVINKS